MFSAEYGGKISLWPRPGSYADFAIAAMAATAEIAPAIVLMSRQGGRFARNEKLLKLFYKTSGFGVEKISWGMKND